MRVALGAGVTVPVPGAAEVAGFLDDAHIGDPGFLQLHRAHEAADAAAEYDRVEVLAQRFAREPRFDIRIAVKPGELTRHFDELVVAFSAQALRAFFRVFAPHLFGVESQHCRIERVGLLLINPGPTHRGDRRQCDCASAGNGRDGRARHGWIL